MASSCYLIREYLLLLQFLGASDVIGLFNKCEENNPELRLIERISQTLNYFAFQLAGPQSAALKVKNPKELNFEPKFLLKTVSEILIHFGTHIDKFAEFVVKDQRSFSPDILIRMESILTRENLIDPKKLLLFASVKEKVLKLSRELIKEEEDLGEIPEEFLDPIQCSLMEDPVILPSSKTVIDRATIKRHLANTATDPFNRSHLTEEMLIPNEELKKKILEWRIAKKSE